MAKQSEPEKKPSLSSWFKKGRYNEMVYENWEGNREMGKRKFIIRFGVFSWGISTFVIYWILMFALNLITKANAAFNLYQVIVTLLLFVFFGLIYGTVLWNRNEKVYLSKFPYGKKTKKKK